MPRARLVPVLLLSLAAGCGAEFTPRSVLFDQRVLAIRATPLEAGPTDSVTLDAYRVPSPGDDGTALEETWTFCPFSVGSSAGYACAVPSCEVPLTASGAATQYVSAQVTATPGALALDCLAALSGSGALPPELSGELPEKIETLFRYVVRGPDGPPSEAVLRFPLYPAGAPPDRNAAPEISSVSIGGIGFDANGDPVGGTAPTLRPGATLDVRVVLTPESAQPYVEGGRTLTEQLVVSFYTTAGRFDYDWANGPDAVVTLKPEKLAAGTASAQVWVVARDLRGGQTVGGPYGVKVEP